MIRNARRLTLAVAAVLLLGACTSEDDDAANRGDEMGGGMDGMQDMDGMPGMSGGNDGSDMMADMQGHMEMMQGMTGDSLRGMLATHRQMMGNMIAQMNREMRDMNMPADPAWNATMDSLRSDLTAMADMDAAELTALMPGHHRRAMRVMEMHREMMAGMQM